MARPRKVKSGVETAEAVMEKKNPRITLPRLIAEGKEIWVINRTGQVTGREAGPLIMQAGSGNMVEKIVVPAGDDPVCLTDQVPPKLLSECADLFKCVQRGALELLDPDYADKYYSGNRDRRKIVQEKIDSFLTTKAPTDKQPSKMPRVGDKSSILETQPKVKRPGNQHVNQKVGDICLKAKHGAITEREAVERMVEQTHVLKEDDYLYVMQNGAYDGLKRWAKEQLRELQSSPAGK